MFQPAVSTWGILSGTNIPDKPRNSTSQQKIIQEHCPLLMLYAAWRIPALSAASHRGRLKRNVSVFWKWGCRRWHRLPARDELQQTALRNPPWVIIYGRNSQKKREIPEWNSYHHPTKRVEIKLKLRAQGPKVQENNAHKLKGWSCEHRRTLITSGSQ